MSEFNAVTAINELIRKCRSRRDLAVIQRERHESYAVIEQERAAKLSAEIAEIDAEIAGWDAAREAARAANRAQFAAVIDKSS